MIHVGSRPCLRMSGCQGRPLTDSQSESRAAGRGPPPLRKPSSHGLRARFSIKGTRTLRPGVRRVGPGPAAIQIMVLTRSLRATTHAARIREPSRVADSRADAGPGRPSPAGLCYAPRWRLLASRRAMCKRRNGDPLGPCRSRSDTLKLGRGADHAGAHAARRRRRIGRRVPASGAARVAAVPQRRSAGVASWLRRQSRDGPARGCAAARTDPAGHGSRPAGPGLRAREPPGQGRYASHPSQSALRTPTRRCE